MATIYADINDAVATQAGYEAVYGAGTWATKNGATTNPRSRDDLVFQVAGGNTINVYGTGTISGNFNPIATVGATPTINLWNKDALGNPWRLRVTGTSQWGGVPGPPLAIQVSGGIIQIDGASVIRCTSTSFFNFFTYNCALYFNGGLDIQGQKYNAPPNSAVWIAEGCYININGLFTGSTIGGCSGTFTAQVSLTDCIYVATNAFHENTGGCATTPLSFTANNIVTNRANSAGLADSGTVTVNKSQYAWSPTALPVWNSVGADWDYSTIGVGILSSPPTGATGAPNPGNTAPTYTDYPTDLWGNTRTGIGNGKMQAATPALTISPLSKSFWFLGNNLTADQTMSISNTGGAALVIGSLSGLSAPFSLVNDFVSNARFNSNGDTSTVVVRYHPTTLGASSANLVIPSNDSTKSVYVDGTSLGSIFGVSPSSKSFGVVSHNSTSTQVVTVTNTGNNLMTMSTLSGLSTPYSILNDHISGVAVNSGQSSVDATVVYHPTAGGATTQTLTITSDSSNFGFRVDGTATMPISYYNVGTVADGASATSTVSLDQLLTSIQAVGSDPYFDSTTKINRIDVFYVHQDGRQQKVVTHKPPHTGHVSWASGALDGVWKKDHIRVYDADGAVTELSRTAFGAGEDLTHGSGSMTLNT